MNLNLMTVSELRKLAAQFGIAGRSTMKKAELIAALSADEFAGSLEIMGGIAELEAEEREMNEIRAEIVAEKSHVEALTTDKVVPAGMFDPELTYYADGTHVVMRTQDIEQRGVAVGMTTDAGPYQFQSVRFADGTVKNVAPHVLHRDEIAEQAAYIEDELKADADAGTYSPVNEVAILRDAPGTAIVTAVFEGRTVGGSIVRKGKTLVLTAGTVTISGNSFEKVAKRLAAKLGFRAERIDVARSF